MARRFVDARGMEWEVWEVGAWQELADVGVRRRSGEGAWLRFDSATQWRRLDRYPAAWEAMSAADLEALCAAAHAEPPVWPVAQLADLDLP